MKRYKVIIPADVKQQLRQQVLYIARGSVDNALAWEDRVRDTMAALRDFHGHAVDEEAGERTGQTLRKTVFEGTYLIHYRVDDAAAEVVIVGIRHGARLPQEGEP